MSASVQELYSHLSLRNLIVARDTFHAHLINKRNVVATAVGPGATQQLYELLCKEVQDKNEQVLTLKSHLKAIPKINDAKHALLRTQLQADVASFQRQLENINESIHRASTPGERNRYENLKSQVCMELSHATILFDVV